jgi:hypothetical protein
MTQQSVVIEGTVGQFCNSNECMGEKNLDWYLDALDRVIDVNSNCEVPNVSYDKDDDSSEGEKMTLIELLPKRKRPQVNAYGRYIKQFTDLCNLVSVTDDGMDRLFDESFHNLRSNILQYQNRGKEGDSTLATFPNISTVKKTT